MFCLFSWEFHSYWAVKVTKTCGYLIHDRASEGHGSVPEMLSETALHRYFQRTTMKQFVMSFQE